MLLPAEDRGGDDLPDAAADENDDDDDDNISLEPWGRRRCGGNGITDWADRAFRPGCCSPRILSLVMTAVRGEALNSWRWHAHLEETAAALWSSPGRAAVIIDAAIDQGSCMAACKNIEYAELTSAQIMWSLRWMLPASSRNDRKVHQPQGEWQELRLECLSGSE